jgi:hypothetical protein
MSCEAKTLTSEKVSQERRLGDCMGGGLRLVLSPMGENVKVMVFDDITNHFFICGSDDFLGESSSRG